MRFTRLSVQRRAVASRFQEVAHVVAWPRWTAAQFRGRPKVIHQVILRKTPPGRYEQDLPRRQDGRISRTGAGRHAVQHERVFPPPQGWRGLTAVIIEPADAHQGDEAKEQPGGNPKLADPIPVHPTVRAAFERAAAGLPPEPRKRL